MDIPLISVVLSISALIVSLVSLWKTSLTPFKVKVCYSDLTFCLYKITPKMSGGKKIWWIPSIDIGFSFHNLGKSSGEVTDIRVVGNLKSKDGERKCIFYAKWIVDYGKFRQNRADRFEWISSAIDRKWFPLILAGDEQKSLYIIFEGGRWDKKYTGELSLSLEVFSSEKERWVECDKYELLITDGMYEEFHSYSLENVKLEKIRERILEGWDHNGAVEI